jgi:hypothetical protein
MAAAAVPAVNSQPSQLPLFPGIRIQSSSVPVVLPVLSAVNHHLLHKERRPIQ